MIVADNRYGGLWYGELSTFGDSRYGSGLCGNKYDMECKFACKSVGILWNQVKNQYLGLEILFDLNK